jgi:hypothetical protein
MRGVVVGLIAILAYVPFGALPALSQSIQPPGQDAKPPARTFLDILTDLVIPKPAKAAKSWNSVIFASVDISSHKYTFAQGLKWAPAGGLDASGFRVLSSGSASQASLAGNQPAERETKTQAYVLIGLEQLAPWGAFGLYLGPEMTMQSTSASGKLKTSTDQSGLRIQAEWWLHPAPHLLATFKTAISSTDRDIWAATSFGWQLAALQSPTLQSTSLPLPPRLANAYIGPEAEISTTGNYAKMRLGAHLTGVELLGFNTRISGGLQREGHRKASAYLTLGVHWRK